MYFFKRSTYNYHVFALIACSNIIFLQAVAVVMRRSRKGLSIVGEDVINAMTFRTVGIGGFGVNDYAHVGLALNGACEIVGSRCTQYIAYDKYAAETCL